VVGGALSGANSILGIAGWRWVFLVNVRSGWLRCSWSRGVLNVRTRPAATGSTGGRCGRWSSAWCGAVVAEQGQQWGWAV